MALNKQLKRKGENRLKALDAFSQWLSCMQKKYKTKKKKTAEKMNRKRKY